MNNIIELNEEEKQELIEYGTLFLMQHQILMVENLEYLDSFPTKENRILQMDRIRGEYHLQLENLPIELRIKENKRIKNEYYENRRKNNYEAATTDLQMQSQNDKELGIELQFTHD